MERAKVMGIVNVTPDSFSDGGEFLDPERAIAHGRELANEGADILDIGGESTRPGAQAVDPGDERLRVQPVIEALAPDEIPISIDTSQGDVAEAALSAGASMINDVTALRADPDLAAVCAETGRELVLMHMLGDPRTMQREPHLRRRRRRHQSVPRRADRGRGAPGIDETRIWVDPGIGFGKTVEHNLELLRRLGELAELGRPIAFGSSRKSFIGKLDRSRGGPAGRRHDRLERDRLRERCTCCGYTTSSRCARRSRSRRRSCPTRRLPWPISGAAGRTAKAPAVAPVLRGEESVLPAATRSWSWVPPRRRSRMRRVVAGFPVVCQSSLSRSPSSANERARQRRGQLLRIDGSSERRCPIAVPARRSVRRG